MKNLCKNKGLLYLLLIVTIIVPSTAKAQGKAKSEVDVAAANTACKDALFNGNMITESEDAANFYVNVSAKEGLWTIRYYYGASEDTDYDTLYSGTPNGVKEYKGGSPLTITIPKSADDKTRLVVVAELLGNNGGIDEKGNKYNPQGFKNDGEVLYVKYVNSKNKTKKTTCRPGSINIDSNSNFNINGTGAVYTKVFKAITTKQSRTLSEEAQLECIAMQQAKKNIGDDKPFLDEAKIAGYNEKMRQSFPYCYGTNFVSSYDITAATIKEIRQKSLEAYKVYADFMESSSDNSKYEAATEEIEKEGYKLLDYNPNGIKPKGVLSCTKEQLTERTEKYYTRHTEVDGTKDGNACNVVCQEQIQVTYDPPVASKAGLCFQYKVTVKSKVTCKVDLNTNIDWPTPPTACSYSPICEGDDQKTQAGPNEDFDSCINTCDGGKYTQSCINSCYKSVYKNKSSEVKKTATSSIDTKVQRLAKSSKDPYYSDSKCNTNSKIKANIDYCANFFYKTKQKYPMGYYKKVNSSKKWITHTWQPCFSSSQSGCEIEDGKISYTIDSLDKNKAAKTTITNITQNIVEAVKRSSPYYFRTKEVANKNLKSFFGIDTGKNRHGPRIYVIEDDGIKRQYSSYFQCPEVCGYTQDSDNAADCKNSDKEIKKYYSNVFDDIKSKLSKCTASAACKDGKEDENTFQITSDNSAMNDATRKESQFEGKNKTSSDNQCYSPSGNIDMFIPLTSQNSKGPYDLETIQEGQANYECNLNPNGINGKCYGKDNPNYWQHYKTTITYPGTWINLKTGKMRYVKDGVDVNASREKKNYYCTGYDFKSVNKSWWNWKVGPDSCDGTKNTKEDMSKLDQVTIENDHNITAKIIKFGKYNWSFDLNCFYALSNDSCVDTPVPTESTTATPTTKDDGGCDTENSTELCNIKFRPITTSDLFPGKNGEAREAGFNWSSKATDKTITSDVNQSTGYGIDPGKYAEQLKQKTEEQEFEGTVDYYIHLTKEKIKELRSYAKKHDYTTFGEDKNSGTPAGTYKKVEGVEGLYYYNSKILDGFGSNIERNVKLGVNNN